MNTFVLITGASSGIGKSLAITFAQDKHNLVLVARRLDQLTIIANDLKERFNVHIHCITADLADKTERLNLISKIEELGISIDCFINNAGIGLNANFADADYSKMEQLMRLNIEGLVHLSKFYVEHAQKQGFGHLVQIASTAAFYSGPKMAVYYASKAFVVSFSKAIRKELKHSKISVSIVCPGPTKTEFQHSAGMDNSALFNKTGNAVQSAEKVANYTFKKIKEKKHLIIPGLINKVSVALAPITPTFISNLIITKLH